MSIEKLNEELNKILSSPINESYTDFNILNSIIDDEPLEYLVNEDLLKDNVELLFQKYNKEGCKKYQINSGIYVDEIEIEKRNSGHYPTEGPIYIITIKHPRSGGEDSFKQEEELLKYVIPEVVKELESMGYRLSISKYSIGTYHTTIYIKNTVKNSQLGIDDIKYQLINSTSMTTYLKVLDKIYSPDITLAQILKDFNI